MIIKGRWQYFICDSKDEPRASSEPDVEGLLDGHGFGLAWQGGQRGASFHKQSNDPLLFSFLDHQGQTVTL